MIPDFVAETAPSRVVFGRGAFARLGEEADRLGARRVLVLTTGGRGGQGEEAARILGDRAAGVWPEAKMHTPVEVTVRALAAAGDLKADALLAVGGGSAIGLGKAMALAGGLPLIAAPTTYSGSEMTDVVGETAAGVKTTKKDPRVRPKAVVYDVELTLFVPPKTSAASAFNAIAHAAEALYAKDGNPLISLMAEEGVRALGAALPALMRDARDIDARSEALYGAWLCGSCLAATGMALHHKLCHTLGGSFGLPHAETHAIVLSHALAYNAPAAPEAMTRLSRALGAEDAPEALRKLLATTGLPTHLAQLGLSEADVGTAADIAARSPYWNPRPVDREGLYAVLRKAWTG